MNGVINTTVPPKYYPNFASYKAWLEEAYRSFAVNERYEECGPLLGPTLSGPDRAPWKLEWAISFQDNHFIKCAEHYERRSGRPPEEGYLGHFSYHYGLQSGGINQAGFPRHSTGKGTFIRFDLDSDHKDHFHFGGKDHIPQDSVRGSLIILDITMFGFIDQVLQHRSSGKPLNECFHFEVT